MKRLVSSFLAVCAALALVSCCEDKEPTMTAPTPPPVLAQTKPTEGAPNPTGNNDTDDRDEPLDGKIAIIHYTPFSGRLDFFVAQRVAEKLGSDKVVTMEWPTRYDAEQDVMVEMIEELGRDPSIRAIVVGYTKWGTSAAFEHLAGIRDDIFVVFCLPDETQEVNDLARLANVTLVPDDINTGPAAVRQAWKLGAETVVYYSFDSSNPRPGELERRNGMERQSGELGVRFVEVDMAIPRDANRIPDLQEYQQMLLDDVNGKAVQYGKDTAFFSSDSYAQAYLIRSVISARAIFTSHKQSYALLDIAGSLNVDYLNRSMLPGEYGLVSSGEMAASISAVLAKNGMSGRVSSMPVYIEELMIVAGVEYAIKWISGEVKKEGIDIGAMRQLMADYAGAEVFLSPITKDYINAIKDDPGNLAEPVKGYGNVLLVRMDYITY